MCVAQQTAQDGGSKKAAVHPPKTGPHVGALRTFVMSHKAQTSWFLAQTAFLSLAVAYFIPLLGWTRAAFGYAFWAATVAHIIPLTAYGVCQGLLVEAWLDAHVSV